MGIVSHFVYYCSLWYILTRIYLLVGFAHCSHEIQGLYIITCECVCHIRKWSLAVQECDSLADSVWFVWKPPLPPSQYGNERSWLACNLGQMGHNGSLWTFWHDFSRVTSAYFIQHKSSFLYLCLWALEALCFWVGHLPVCPSTHPSVCPLDQLWTDRLSVHLSVLRGSGHFLRMHSGSGLGLYTFKSTRYDMYRIVFGSIHNTYHDTYR